jgi:hypothetical protein
MNNLNHISDSLETIFWVKILKFFDAAPDPGWKKNRILDKHPGSAALAGDFPSVDISVTQPDARPLTGNVSVRTCNA